MATHLFTSSIRCLCLRCVIENRVIRKQIENVALNDVLPLKADRRNAIANLKCFGAPAPRDTNDLISMVSFTFTMRRHHIRLAAAPLTSSRLAKCGWVPFAMCNTWQRSRPHNLRRVCENSGTILTRL